MIQLRAIDTVAEAEQAAAFLQSVWADGPEVVPVDLLVAGAHVDSYAFTAFDGDQIVGASFAFHGRFNGKTVLHSHVTAATVKGVGYDLKLHQRDWAATRGVEAITWTFDPLVRRNCYFNFAKLGATAIEYLPNFYGSMPDAINAGEESDRLFAWWPTTPTDAATRTEVARIELPEDIETMRVEDLEAASAWRVKVREQLAPLFATGAVISAMTQDRTHLIVSK